jgi:hypothetical protein
MMLKLLNGLQKDMGLLLSPVVLVEDQGMFVFYLGMLSAILFKMCNLLRSSFTSVSGVIGQYAKCQDKFDSETRNRVLCDLRRNLYSWTFP